MGKSNIKKIRSGKYLNILILAWSKPICLYCIWNNHYDFQPAVFWVWTNFITSFILRYYCYVALFAALFANYCYTNQQYKCYRGANIHIVFPIKFCTHILSFCFRQTSTVSKHPTERKHSDFCSCKVVKPLTNSVKNKCKDIPSLHCKIV